MPKSICPSSTCPPAPTAAGRRSFAAGKDTRSPELVQISPLATGTGLRHTRVVIWEPGRYLRFSSERALPFRHLVAAVDHLQPATVVDVGCGPGGLTATLLDRWPAARIVGIDTSQEMIDHARRRTVPGRLSFEVDDALAWRAPDPVDLLLSNACFQWIGDHRALFEHLIPQLSGNGTLAFQVPANHDAPSHTILRDLCSSPRWRTRLGGLPRTGVREPSWYFDVLTWSNCSTTAWETVYHHILEGDNPVLEWVRGTALRPVLDRLDEHEQTEFITSYGTLLREAYPECDGKTILCFKRLFVVATRQ